MPCSLPVDSPVLSLFWKKNIYSFTFAVLGLRCWVRTLDTASGCYSLWVLSTLYGYSLLSMGIQASHCGGFSYCKAWSLGPLGSVSVCTGSVTSKHVESSRTRDLAHVLRIGRWILNSWTTREVLTDIISLSLQHS